jgi:hypothetical protein
MTRGIGSFFDAFSQGYDTVGRVMQDAALNGVAAARPNVSEGFTAADGDQLAAMANAKDENGNPYYTIEPAEGGYRVKNNFQVDGAQAPDTSMAPRRVTDFLGQRYDGEMNESQVANARMRAMSDVVARNDPVAGLRLRQQALQGEREDQRFQREMQEGDYRLAALGRADTQGRRVEDIQSLSDEVARYTPEQLHAYAGQANVAPGGQVPLLYTGQTKGGYQFVTIDPKSGAPMKPLTLNEAQTRQLATAAKLLERGFGAEGTQMMAGISKELNDLVVQLNGVTAQTTTSQNNARHQDNADQFRRQELGIQAGEAARRGRLADLQIKEIESGRADLGEARKLQSDYDSLTPAQQMGAEGQAIIRKFNMLNAKPGGQLNLGLQRGGGNGSAAIKYETDNLWADIEKKLAGANTPPQEIQQQRDAFYTRRGFATDIATQTLLDGRDPETGRRLTEQDVDAFNRAFPHTPVDKSKLPWLKPTAGQPGKGLPTKPANRWEKPATTGPSFSDFLEAQRRAAREEMNSGFNPYRQNTVR